MTEQLVASGFSRVLIAEGEPHDQMLLVTAVQEVRADLRLGFLTTAEELVTELRCLAGDEKLPAVLVLALEPSGLGGLEVLDRLEREPLIRPAEVGVVGPWQRRDDGADLVARGATWFRPEPTRFSELLDFVTFLDERCRHLRQR